MTSQIRAIELVKIISNPRDAAQVHDASEELQTLQHSNDGWKIADDMLGSTSDNVRFYGALTMQIKLNREGSSLEPELAVEILQRILGWIITLACKDERPMILNKLCSTLSTYFVQSTVRWMKAIRQLACSLHSKRVVPNSELNNLQDTATLINQLPKAQKRVAVRFCQNLAEDMLNKATSSQQHADLDDTFQQNASEAASILDVCFHLSIEENSDVTIEALNTLNAWVLYCHNHWSKDRVITALFQNLTPRAAELLFVGHDEVRELAIEIFVSNLDYRVKFFTEQDLTQISQVVRQKLGPECVKACRSGVQEPEIVSLSKLVSSYGKVTVKDVVAVRKSDASTQIIALFLELLTGTGYPVEDDQIILQVSDFWIEYAEHVAYAISGSEGERLNTWLPAIRDDLMHAMQRYIPRLAPPPAEHFTTWDEDSFQLWKYFRENVADFLDFLTEVPDTNLLHHLIDIALRALPTKQWLNLEGVIFCINAIADSVNPASDDPAMMALMGSSIFADASDLTSDVPVVLRRAVLQLINGYSSFIKSNVAYIPPVLTFLFTILETTPSTQTKTADHAAKAFESLASSCRRALTEHLNELLQQCPRALSGPAANAYQKEKVMAALASVIQALPMEEAKAAPLLVLVEIIESDLNAAVSAIQSGDMENGEVLGTTALQCLASIAKGIQALDDTPIDLDSDEDGNSTAERNTTTTSTSATFWTAGAGAQVQARILSCFEIVSYLHNAGDALDAACSVLRAGLAETQPGPFVFPPSTTVTFVVKTTASLAIPRIEAIITTACTFVSAYSRRSSPHLFQEVLTIYESIIRLMSELGSPNNDPQLAQLCIEFLQRLLPPYLDVLLAAPDAAISGVLNFALAGLTGESPLLKRHACSFFETLLSAGRQGNPMPMPATRVPLGGIIAHFAPLVARAVLFQLSGVAQRSEIDALCKPLRAFVFSVPNARGHLENALLSSEVEGVFAGLAAGTANVSQMERRMFVAQVMGLRGSKVTNGKAKEFWAKCKGTVSQFQ